MTIDIPIELTEQDPEDNDPVNNDENNNTDGNDSVDNTTEEDSNSTIDANTDTDGDGVIDTLDACPNTASGITVDEFGCQVIEQDINDEEDETTANPTDTEGNSEQKTDDAATQTDENNVVIYLIIGPIAVAIVGALLFLNSRRSANQTEPSKLKHFSQLCLLLCHYRQWNLWSCSSGGLMPMDILGAKCLTRASCGGMGLTGFIMVRPRRCIRSTSPDGLISHPPSSICPPGARGCTLAMARAVTPMEDSRGNLDRTSGIET